MFLDSGKDMEKFCEQCDTKLVQKEKEKNYNFNKRRFCDYKCSNAFKKDKRWIEELESETFTCVVCKQNLSKCEFWKSKTITRGHVGTCKECSKKSVSYNYIAEVKLEGKKVCTRCNQEKDLLFFGKGQRYKYGYSSECKNCRKLRLKEKRHNNINYKLRCLLRSRITTVVTKGYKSENTLKLLGCSEEKFKLYLESKFQEGMNWKNHGTSKHSGFKCWQIDHIIPCASFDLKDSTQQKICFHYTNLQPLWETDNLKKSNKLNWTNKE